MWSQAEGSKEKKATTARLRKNGREPRRVEPRVAIRSLVFGQTGVLRTT